jgi:hypothetical protein
MFCKCTFAGLITIEYSFMQGYGEYYDDTDTLYGFSVTAVFERLM